jgi:hypothetical protein
VAWLFSHGKINLTYNNETLALGQTPKPTLLNYLTRQEHQAKLVVELRVEVPQHHRQAGEDFMRRWFKQNLFPTNEDQFIQEFKDKARRKEQYLEKLKLYYLTQPELPGEATIGAAIDLLNEAIRRNRASNFFKHLYDTKNEWTQLLDQLTPVESFLEGSQREIYERALLYRQHYALSHAYITDQQVKEKMQEIQAILKLRVPYGEIYKLPSLLEDYIKLHIALLDQEAAPVRKRIDSDRKTVLAALNESPIKDELLATVLSSFENLGDRLKHAQSVHEIRNLGYESDATKINLLDDISRRSTSHQVQQAAAQAAATVEDDSSNQPSPAVRQPVYRHVSMHSLVSASTTLSTPEQVDVYVNQLRNKLLEQLESGDEDGITVVP